jgi:transcriptional regulator with XRE-family HTH domain
MATRIGPRKPRKLFLLEWREHRRLTQERLGQRLGVEKITISRWERDRRGLNVNVLSALAEALDIEPTDLFRHPDQPSADALLRDQSPEIQQQAITIIRALRKAN